MADVRRPWPFALFVLLAHVLSRFLGVGVHELLGHAAVATLLGGSAYGVYVSPGSGITYVYLPPGLPAAGVVAMLGAGIAVETAFGIALWWFTRRSPSAGWRLFGVVAASVLVVYSLVYMASGAFEGFRGDTWAIVSTLQAPALAVGFAAVGILWTLLVGVFLSFDVVRVLGGPAKDLRRVSLMLILFWLVPAPLAFLPGFSAATALEESPVAYVVAFAAVLCSVAALLLYADLLPRPREAAPAPEVGLSWRAIAAAGLPLLFFVPVWVGAFGVTQATATGVLLETPPIQVESAWLGELGINLEVFVHADANFSVTLFWRFHGTFTPASPLEAQIAASFQNRMDRDFYNRLALTLVGDAMNESSWIVAESDIHPNETVWVLGQEYPAARVVRLEPSPLNRFSFLRRVGNDGTLTVHDPFRFEPTLPAEGWLDALKVRWETAPGPGLVPVRFAASGGTSPAIVSADYVLWENFNGPSAHTTYQVTLRPG
jgi:hypothetical protein